jgi:hypothetical protein
LTVLRETLTQYNTFNRGGRRESVLLYSVLRPASTSLVIVKKSPKVGSSNGNDIEAKRSDTSIIGVFSVSKRNEPTYSRSWKDGSEVNTIIIILCRIEEITNIISPEFAGWKRKRT